MYRKDSEKLLFSYRKHLNHYFFFGFLYCLSLLLDADKGISKDGSKTTCGDTT